MNKAYLAILVILLSFLGYFFIHPSHQYNYKLTNYNGNVIYCDDFFMDDSLATIILSNGDTLQMDSVIDIDIIK